MNPTKALLVIFFCYVSWGLQPMYFKLLKGDAYEILAYRILFSCLFLGMLLGIMRKLKNTLRYMKIKKVLGWLFLSGSLIAFNWLIYIYSLVNNRMLEASIGYFIGPMVSIILATLILKEKQSFYARIAIILAIAAACNEVWAFKSLPIISTFIALSFSVYMIIKKKIVVHAFEGLFIETLMITPIAISYLLIISYLGKTLSFSFDFDGLLLAFTGVITVLPLLFFNIGAKYVRISTIGFLGYLTPTLTASLAIFVYHEPLGLSKIISFSLIITGLTIISLEGIINKKTRDRIKKDNILIEQELASDTLNGEAMDEH